MTTKTRRTSSKSVSEKQNLRKASPPPKKNTASVKTKRSVNAKVSDGIDPSPKKGKAKQESINTSLAQGTASFQLGDGKSKSSVPKALAAPMRNLLSMSGEEKSKALSAILAELTRKGSPALPVAAREEIGEAVMSCVQNYLYQWTATLRQATLPQIEETKKLLVTGASVLAKLETPKALAHVFELFRRPDGWTVQALSSHPDIISSVTNAALNIAQSRMDQTVESIKRNDVNPDGWHALTGGDGGYLTVPGQTESFTRWSDDFPGDKPPTEQLVFLGTSGAPVVREALKKFLLNADGTLPKVIDLQRKQPSYSKIREITTQHEVSTLLNALAAYGFENEQAYSPLEAFTQIADVLTYVLAKVKTPQMHRRLADVGFSILRRHQTAGINNSRSDTAAKELKQQLLLNGPDKEIRLLAAMEFAQSGDAVDIQAFNEALGHPNDEIQSLAAANARWLISRGRKADVAPLVPALKKFIAEGIAVWSKVDAVKALAAFEPGNPEALAFASALFAPAITMEMAGTNNPATKNVHMRARAAGALGALGANATAMLPELDAAVAVMKKAKTALELIRHRRYTANAPSDAAALAAVKGALEAGAWTSSTPPRLENEAAKFLRELPTMTDPLGSAEPLMGTLVELGEAAEAAAAAVRTTTTN